VRGVDVSKKQCPHLEGLEVQEELHLSRLLVGSEVRGHSDKVAERKSNEAVKFASSSTHRSDGAHRITFKGSPSDTVHSKCNARI
jgi:hypothetical protein